MDKAETIEQRAERIARQGVNCCLSSMVATLARPHDTEISLPQGSTGQSLYDLVEQAFELSAPIDDYEEAAIQAGWRVEPANGGARVFVARIEPGVEIVASSANPDDACGWEDLCRKQGIEPCPREVYEHWAVSQWLGEKLAAHGERVDFDFAGLVVWARTTTGQSIEMDGVIQRMAGELLK